MTLSVYAELLPNIRQISLAISSDMPLTFDESLTYGNISASIEHHEDICCVLGVYGGLSFCHILPGRVACPGGYELPAPPRSGDGKVATWRLPLLDDGRGPGEAGSGVPWEAKDLGPGSEVSCRKCRASLVGKDGVTEWKDLPAEGWAEMMEFWHCHKPGEEHGHGHGQEEGDGAVVGEQRKADEQSLASRGYGAASSISAQKGVGFVDLTTFLFEEGDCQGITVSLYSDCSREHSAMHSCENEKQLGIKKVAKQSQWHGNRYKYPRVTYAVNPFYASRLLGGPSKPRPKGWRVRGLLGGGSVLCMKPSYLRVKSRSGFIRGTC